METTTEQMLCHPLTGAPLERISDTALRDAASGETFQIVEGIPVLLAAADVSGMNQKYKGLYDKIARGYDFTEKVFGRLLYGKRQDIRAVIVKDVEAPPGAKVLEVSVGTGANIEFLPPEAHYYGLDISLEMLRQCARKFKKLGRRIELVQGAAEHLPFRDESFDGVFTFGGVNFFNDKQRAITELIRVAKPGARIVIGDETEKHVATSYEKTPFIGKYFSGRSDSVAAPINLVPDNMEEGKLETVIDDRFYLLSFRKPARKA